MNIRALFRRPTGTTELLSLVSPFCYICSLPSFCPSLHSFFASVKFTCFSSGINLPVSKRLKQSARSFTLFVSQPVTFLDWCIRWIGDITLLEGVDLGFLTLRWCLMDFICLEFMGVRQRLVGQDSLLGSVLGSLSSVMKRCRFDPPLGVQYRGFSPWS